MEPGRLTSEIPAQLRAASTARDACLLCEASRRVNNKVTNQSRSLSKPPERERREPSLRMAC